MKTALAFAVLECFLLINCLQQFGLALPMMQGDEDTAAITSDVKRDAEYRNALFGVYHCRVKKAAETCDAKLQVTVMHLQ